MQKKHIIYFLYLHVHHGGKPVEKHEKCILDSFCQGDLDSFYKEVFPAFVLFARRYVGSAGELLAEDFVQDAIIKAWERRREFGDLSGLKAFMYVTIHNSLKNSIRKEQARKRYVEQMEDPVFFRNEMIDREAQQLLYNTIRQLPPKLKAVFDLTVFENLTVSEISAHLEIPARTVRKYRQDLIQVLRQKLNPDVLSILIFLITRKIEK